MPEKHYSEQTAYSNVVEIVQVADVYEVCIIKILVVIIKILVSLTNNSLKVP